MKTTSDWPGQDRSILLVDHCLREWNYLDPDLQKDLRQEGLVAAWTLLETHGEAVNNALLRKAIQRQMIDFMRKFGRLVPGRPTRHHRHRAQCQKTLDRLNQTLLLQGAPPILT